MAKEKNTLFKDTIKLSLGIFLNKPIGFLRDILQVKYFGLTLLGDAYVVAWRIPNVLRRIFSEGLMTSVLLPYLVKMRAEESEEQVNKIITMIVIIMQLVVSFFCILVAMNSKRIILLLSPGALDRVFYGSQMLQILIFFTFFTSFSSVLGVAVQLHKKFYVGPLSQFFLNIFFCIELFFSLRYQFSYLTLCMLITANSFVIIAVHLYVFYQNNFYFLIPNRESFTKSIFFFKNFFIAFCSSLLLEINTFAGLSFSSYLTPGLLSLFEYINTLMRLPLQVCGSALASTSQIEIGEMIYKKEYEKLEETIYGIYTFFFVLSLLLSLAIFSFGECFFSIFFFCIGGGTEYILLSTYLLSLFSFIAFPALANKILLNIFYSFHSVSLPTLVTFFISFFSNYLLWIYVKQYGLYFIVISSVLFEFIRFALFYTIIYFLYGIHIFTFKRIKSTQPIMKLLLCFLGLAALIYISLSLGTRGIIFFFKKEVLKVIASSTAFLILFFYQREKK